MVTPFKSFNGSHVREQSGYSPYRSSFIRELTSATKPNKNVVQCKVRLPNGDTRAMSVDEVKQRYLEGNTATG